MVWSLHDPPPSSFATNQYQVPDNIDNTSKHENHIEIEDGSKRKRDETNVRNVNNKPLNQPKSKNKYQCSCCGKGFQWKSHLDTHVRMRTGEKPFKCNYKNGFCQKAFTQSNHLTKHINPKHNDFEIDCLKSLMDCLGLKSLRYMSHVHIQYGDLKNNDGQYCYNMLVTNEHYECVIGLSWSAWAISNIVVL